MESVFERAVRESFEPVLQKYLSDNSAAVIERMKPLIREWMDEHFPALLEGAVRAEVERVVKARGPSVSRFSFAALLGLERDAGLT